MSTTDMLKIIRINAYIQRDLGKVSLDGKEIVCVALDRTCAFAKEGESQEELTDEQLNRIFLQTFGFPEEGRAYIDATTANG